MFTALVGDKTILVLKMWRLWTKTKEENLKQDQKRTQFIGTIHLTGTILCGRSKEPFDIGK